MVGGMRVLGLLALTAIGSAVAPMPATAWSCGMEPDDLSNAIAGDSTYGDTVVIGTVVSVTSENRYAEMTVEHVLRGSAGIHVTLESQPVQPARDEAPAYGPLLPLKVDVRYIIVGFTQTDATLRVTVCGPSRVISSGEAERLVNTALTPSAPMHPLTWLGLLALTAALGCRAVASLSHAHPWRTERHA